MAGVARPDRNPLSWPRRTSSAFSIRDSESFRKAALLIAGPACGREYTCGHYRAGSPCGQFALTGSTAPFISHATARATAETLRGLPGPNVTRVLFDGGDAKSRSRNVAPGM